MPGVDPAAALAWMDAFPGYAKVGWALGVWGGLLGAILLLIRSRYAVWAFALSMLGIVLSIGWQLAAAPALSGADSPMAKIIPIIVIVIGLFLLWYSWTMEKRGVLR
jgi:cell division protein FtsX